ncbi:flavin-dependent oxidoreductase F420-dependent methylene-tetrahydromethanopterin reductase [Pseudonocardia sulfidoxydans NBRC 16205]|uniref:Flavin-dependent oxidoreductase F420-dependent methylene-tetrahydromethanopterin reductase n=1 Tax=Pseudonocardia sulfidoxydans NBRC 16205 TaxID=1223511 RepID=A0A511DFT8_9PSEU|nr:NtaA/DmoA family FMN-dependent monooxygenase [Pseudonocardia sulfidoxydans]GEL23649.1 flavin-dependent oxidoreductase F420-dependent methylene-tetrahydromethanopterin reductase [Pseudonocardia sulfidoxydans NBRC 16205]
MTDRPSTEPQVHLGVFLTGVGPQLIWAHPDAAPHMAIETFVDVVQLLERGLFDAFFLGEGLRVRENRGRPYDLDVAGRPDAITQLAALAGATSRIGLVATQNTTYNEPADLARRLASLDLLSDGRAGWNIVTTDNAWTGENFRHGGWLEHARRYERAGEFVEAAKALWAAWEPDAAQDARAKSWSRPGAIADVRRATDLVHLTATPTVPGSRQGRPVLFQAGDSAGGRDLAARHADVVFTAHTEYDAALAYATDLRERLARHGRSPDSLRILPGAGVVLGDTPADAEDKARWVREEQITGPRALAYFEQYWGADLSGYDPDGPLPDIEPSADELDPSRGTISIDRRKGKLDLIARWREQAAAQGLSIRQLALEVSPGHPSFVGTPGQVADEWARFVRTRAVDGFNLLPYLIPQSLTEIVEKLVPALQDRGVYRTEYTGGTLRDHLALPPVDDTGPR